MINGTSLNFSCTFIKNSPALGCRIITNGKEYIIPHDNSHTSVSMILPISERFQNISVAIYEIEKNNKYTYIMTIKIVLNDTTGGNDTACKCAIVRW